MGMPTPGCCTYMHMYYTYEVWAGSAKCCLCCAPWQLTPVSCACACMGRKCDKTSYASCVHRPGPMWPGPNSLTVRP